MIGLGKQGEGRASEDDLGMAVSFFPWAVQICRDLGLWHSMVIAPGGEAGHGGIPALEPGGCGAVLAPVSLEAPRRRLFYFVVSFDNWDLP